jgi:carboxyl-terminal processing protease
MLSRSTDVLFLRSLLMLLTVFITTNCVFAHSTKEGGKKYNTADMLHLFESAFNRIQDDYVEEETAKTLVESAINGMLSDLDPHSGFLDAKSFQEMTLKTEGEFGGLGIEVTSQDGLIKVVSPIDDTPAMKAGLEPNDYITHIDGDSIVGLDLSSAVDRMRGKIGTKINITIRRVGSEPFDVEITRALIRVRPVRAENYGHTAYIRITTFNKQTLIGLQRNIKKARRELGEDLRGYVIDLRNNPGGLLDQAVAVSDAFLNSGEIVSTRGRRKADTSMHFAKEGDLTAGKPIVILINNGSASASEIVAGALQDHNRAVVVGEKSFGKGSVQTLIPLPDYGAMRLTTARFYTPSGRSIQAEGIVPDIIIKRAKVEEISVKPLIGSESDLVGALTNTDKKTDQGEKPSQQETLTDAQQEKLTKDYQLARAMDILKAVSLYNSYGRK